MTTADQVRVLESQTLEALSRGSSYYENTRIAWRIAQESAAAGKAIVFQDAAAGTPLDDLALAELAQDYITGYLAESVFQQYVSQLEDYLFGLIGCWLMAYPGGIAGLDDDPGDDKLRKADKTVPLALIVDNPDR